MRNFMQAFSKQQIATAIALLFHSIGLIGILFFNSPAIIQATPFNLLLSFVLIMYTHPKKNKWFLAFIFITAFVGFLAEIIGVHTGYLFGSYHYLQVLGPKLYSVPILIAINWFIIMYCCGISTHTLLQKAIAKLAADGAEIPVKVKAISIIIDGATVAVFFDWIMEPVAVQLKFWQWHGDGTIPLYNYCSWFLISTALLALFHFFKFTKQNKFGIHLLMIQTMFFLLLRCFYLP
jgi:bisanhydrobacterioruberin hydratase